MKSSKAEILIVEDSEVEQKFYRATLANDYVLTFASTGAEAETRSKSQSFDLVILDIMLPDKDGYEICSHLRENEMTKNVPIIFITSKKTLPDQLTAFALGADDFLTKPVNALELKARILSKLRHLKAKADSTLLRGPIEIDLSGKRVYLVDNDQRKNVKLTKHEYELLRYLAANIDHAISREQILNAVWGSEMHVSDRTVDSHISKLRKKLGRAGNNIESVHGSGYRFTLLPETKKAAS